MAEGRVKDPEGHQSKPYDFGYIQRRDTDPPVWPDSYTGKKRAIPYLNKKDLGEMPKLHSHADINKEVDFVVREAVVCKKEGNTFTEVGTIGIAICTEQTILMELFPDPPTGITK